MGVIATTVVVVCLVIFLVIAAFRNDQYISPVSTNKGSAFSGVSKIAFGSCTAYDERDIEIFQTGIVPFQPDAWIWLGDMVYMDTAFIDCAESPGHPDCSCDASFLGGPPTQCFAGDLDHARDKVVRFVGSPSYQAFLGYMCPGHELLGSVVPGGTDPEQCLRPIVGTYDDHDSGWNNGNSRLPDRHAFKSLFLDAIGEPQDSPRRSMAQGLQSQVTFNGDNPSQRIDVFLLDERFYRVPLPCSVRRRYCQGVLSGEFEGEATNKTLAWCEDFLNGGPLGQGTCCKRDDELFGGWCRQHNALNGSEALWREACDPTAEEYGQRNLVVRNGNVAPADPLSAEEMSADSQLCEVLGRPQRTWLREALRASPAPLKLVASGSVVFGRPRETNSEDSLPGSAKNLCSGDDWDCYRAARLNLIHTIANTTSGCVVVLTGDYHFADIKAVLRGVDTPYAAAYQAEKLGSNLFQVMSSGLSRSTAHSSNEASDCEGYKEDRDGLRPGGPCWLYTAPNFGAVEVDWGSRQVKLSIRTITGDIAGPADTSLPPLALTMSLDTCELV